MKQNSSGWITLLAGLTLWTLVQGISVTIPVWTRQLPPEVDDSLAYLVRTQEMQECFFQDCPALQDLKEQREIGLNDPRILRAHALSAFPFPVYHPLFSLLLLGAKALTGDLITAYKVLWSLGPLLFGVSFACLLTALWGKDAAGAGLGLLAFKVFPDTGLHYFTPSNLAMGVAVLVWARIIARRGNAPWTLLLGSVVLLSIHPAGGVYALMAAALALAMPGEGSRKKLWLPTAAVFVLFATAVAIASIVKKPSFLNVLEYLGPNLELARLLSACGSNLVGMVVGISQLQESLLGTFAIFLPAVAAGMLLATSEQRTILARTMLLYALVLVVSLLHSHEVSPMADLFFRLWIPFVVILFGAVGKALVELGLASLDLLKNSVKTMHESAAARIGHAWPVMAFALLAGYAADMAMTGGEHLVVTAEHLRNRQALSFSPGQADRLASEAGPQDRVLYMGLMPMAFYFTRGALQRGAVYYHPAYAGTPIETDWLTRPDLRFAVAYHPAVHHPLLEGLEEKDQCISRPDYRFSSLSKPRRYGHILKEGFIMGEDFQWLEILPTTPSYPGRLRILVRNTGASQDMRIAAVEADGSERTRQTLPVTAPPRRTGWMDFEPEAGLSPVRYRLELPGGRHGLSIGGIVFGNSHLKWPWEQKATITLLARDPNTGRVTLNFDPEVLLPPTFSGKTLTVLDDDGSTVLMRIER